MNRMYVPIILILSVLLSLTAGCTKKGNQETSIVNGENIVTLSKESGEVSLSFRVSNPFGDTVLVIRAIKLALDPALYPYVISSTYYKLEPINLTPSNNNVPITVSLIYRGIKVKEEAKKFSVYPILIGDILNDRADVVIRIVSDPNMLHNSSYCPESPITDPLEGPISLTTDAKSCMLDSAVPSVYSVLLRFKNTRNDVKIGKIHYIIRVRGDPNCLKRAEAMLADNVEYDQETNTYIFYKEDDASGQYFYNLDFPITMHLNGEGCSMSAITISVDVNITNVQVPYPQATKYLCTAKYFDVYGQAK